MQKTNDMYYCFIRICFPVYIRNSYYNSKHERLLEAVLFKHHVIVTLGPYGRIAVKFNTTSYLNTGYLFI